MEIALNYNKQTKKWSAVLHVDGYKDAVSMPRPGCAVREVLNRFQYSMGAPSGNLTVRIDGW